MGRRARAVLAVVVALGVGIGFVIYERGDRSQARDTNREQDLLQSLDLENESCCPALVGNAARDAALIWSSPRSEGPPSRGEGIHVAFLRGGDWSADTRIPRSPYIPRRMVQGMLADGSVVVVWEPWPDRGRSATIGAAIVDPAGAVTSSTLFARPQAKDGSGPFPARGVRLDELTPVAVAGGRALVAWGWRDRSGSHLGVAVWHRGRWTIDEAPRDDRPLPWRASVAIGDRGDTLAIWWSNENEYAPGGFRVPVRAAYRPAGREWSTPETVARLRLGNVDVLARPTATLLADGRPAVQWAAAWRGGRVAVRVRVREHGLWLAVPADGVGALGSASPIRVGGNDIAPPMRVGVIVRGRGLRNEVASVPISADFVANGGNASFVWPLLADDPTYLSSDRQAAIGYSILGPGGFSDPSAIPGAETKVEVAGLLLRDGDLVVAYASDGPVDEEDGIHTVVLDRSDGWRRPVRVSP